MRAFVQTFRHVLAGDRAALAARYRIGFSRDGEDWALTLHPKDAELGQFIRELRLEGRGRGVKRMRMTEASGDVTVTTFTSVELDKRWTAAERARVFRLP